MKAKDWFFKTRKMNPEVKVAEKELTPACTQIHQWIEQNMIGERSVDVNRASSAPKCVKQRWFLANGHEGEKLNARAIVTFGFGDLTEHWMKDLIKRACVGPDKIYSEVDFGLHKGTFTVQHREFQDYEQEHLEINVPGCPKVSAHADGWGKRNSDGQWELIEIKSSATYGFDEFVAGEVPDYIRQLHALMITDKAKALQVRSARLFYMNKNTSHIFDRLYEFDREVAKQVVREFIVAAGEAEPARPGGDYEPVFEKKTGKLKLNWRCSYCPFTAKCWAGEAKMEFKNGKPVWYLITDTRKESCG